MLPDSEMYSALNSTATTVSQRPAAGYQARAGLQQRGTVCFNCAVQSGITLSQE